VIFNVASLPKGLVEVNVRYGSVGVAGFVAATKTSQAVDPAK